VWHVNIPYTVTVKHRRCDYDWVFRGGFIKMVCVVDFTKMRCLWLCTRREGKKYKGPCESQAAFHNRGAPLS